jgi:hypothetical protein
LNCKYLLEESTITTTTTTTATGGGSDQETELQVRQLCLINVLQYILGSSSSNKSARSLSSSTPLVQQAFSLLVQHHSSNNPTNVVVTPNQRTTIEALVFCHKSILIGDKTLVDTVLPQLHWTLRAAKKKSSCACCLTPEEEEEENDNSQKKPMEVSPPSHTVSINASTTANNTSKHLKFVDGRAKFAFDPSAFAIRKS